MATMTAQAAKPKPRTLNDIFYSIVDQRSECVMMFKDQGTWHPISSSQLYTYVCGVANALRAWGLGRGDRVAILSENRPEWSIADFACQLIGIATVPIYATLTAEHCSYLLKHSSSRAVFVSNESQLKKIESVRAECGIEHVIMMDPAKEKSGAVISMQAMMQSGPTHPDVTLDHIARTITREDLATLIYTSGTTGTPKGVMLTHGNIASNLEVSLDAFDFETGNEVMISFLPLSHITARHVDFACLFRGVVVAYCPAIEDLPAMMQEIKPTFFVGVPRVYEKIYNQALRKASTGGKKKIFDWAVKVGEEHINEILAGKTPKSLRWRLADRLVYSKIREAMGGRGRVYISGGAPLGRELGEWFAKVGIRICEGYGLTETSPVIAVNSPYAYKLGTVGRPLPNLELHIADDGEILVRGPSVFKGYWNMPEETAAALHDGWFKTGDIGKVDVDGFLSVTDRKKDLIKTSGGKFIAPQPIENSLKANPLIAEAAIVGDKRRFPAVVLVPSFAQLEDWAHHNNVAFENRAQLVANRRVQALYEGIVEDVNQNLAKFEKLKKVLVIAEEPSVNDGTLTPSLKLRRRNFEAKYKHQIDRMYAEVTAGDPSIVQ